MRTRPGREFLQTPGPTNIPGRILNAMHRPALDFSSPAFMDLAVSCFRDIKPLFQTDGEIFFYTASGHGAWEGAFVNLFEPGDLLLMPETGRFSVSWGLMAKALGLEIETFANDWRHALDPDQVEDALRADTERRIKGVMVVHTETATGATSDIKAVAEAIAAAGHPAYLVVDAIASFMTVDIPMDAWGIDVLVAASQKGLMMPPGLSFVAAGARALDGTKTCETPREYWSWTARLGREQYHAFCGTAPEHLIFGLREAIDILNEEGLDNVFARHQRLADAVRACVGDWARGNVLSFNTIEPRERANALTVVRTPDGYDAETIRHVARDVFDVACGGGLSQLSGKVFRIGHMGDNNDPIILGALGGIEAALRYLEIPHESGLAAAARSLAETAPEIDTTPDPRRIM